MLELYHLSFNPTLTGRWSPKQPDGENEHTDKSKDTFENLPPRISVGPTIEQCFWAIYPNVSQYFEKLRYPYMLMYVYRPAITPHTKFIDPREVSIKVHDAYMTQELCITTPTLMHKIAKVKIMNCTKNPIVEYRKFNDPDRPLEFLSHRIDWKIESSYIPNQLKHQLMAMRRAKR